MAVAEACRCGNRRPDRLDQLPGALERPLLPASDDCAGDLLRVALLAVTPENRGQIALVCLVDDAGRIDNEADERDLATIFRDRKSTRLNSSHVRISYAVFC